MKKRGQVTIFIIIGIVILITIVGIFYVIDIITKSALQKEALKVGTVPQQIIPVRDFINTCVQETASNGINLLEGQGGYIELPEDDTQESLITPFTNKLELFEGSNQKNLIVPDMIKKLDDGFKKIYRFPFWLRKGYIEELYEIEHSSKL